VWLPVVLVVAVGIVAGGAYATDQEGEKAKGTVTELGNPSFSMLCTRLTTRYFCGAAPGTALSWTQPAGTYATGVLAWITSPPDPPGCTLDKDLTEVLLPINHLLPGELGDRHFVEASPGNNGGTYSMAFGPGTHEVHPNVHFEWTCPSGPPDETSRMLPANTFKLGLLSFP
jgi:hypothetical protein